MKKTMTGIAAVLVGLLLNAFILPPKASANKVVDPYLTWYEVEPDLTILLSNPLNPVTPMTKSQFVNTYPFACHGFGLDCVRGFYPEEPPVDENQNGVITLQKDL